jgi:hypothetical protein
LLLRGTAESGALKANALPGGARRLAVRAVKEASVALIEAKRRALTGEAGGPGAGFQQEGQREKLSIKDSWGCIQSLRARGFKNMKSEWLTEMANVLILSTTPIYYSHVDLPLSTA